MDIGMGVVSHVEMLLRQHVIVGMNVGIKTPRPFIKTNITGDMP